MIYYLISAFIASLVICVIGFFVLIKAPTKRLHVFFFLFCLFYSLNSIGAECNYFVDNPKIAYWIWVEFSIASVLAQSLLILFILEFIQDRNLTRLKIGKWHLFSGILVSFSLIFLPYQITKKNNFWLVEAPFFIYVLYILFTIFTALFIAYLLFQNFKINKKNIIGYQIKYLVSSIAIIFCAVILDTIQQIYVTYYSPNFGLPITFNLSYLAAIFFTFAMAFNIVKHKFLDIKTAIHQTLIWGILSVSTFIPFLLSVYIWSKYKFLSIKFEILSLFIICFLFIWLFQFFRPKLDNLFYRKKYIYLSIFTKYQTLLNTFSDFDRIIQILNQLFSETIYPTSFCLYYFDKKSSIFKTKNDDIFFRAEISQNEVESLQIFEKLILYQNNDIEKKITKNQSHSVNLRLIIPISFQEKLIGFIALCEKKNLKDYSAIDLDFLGVVALQLSSTINNFLLSEEINQEKIEKLKIIEQEKSIRNLTYFISHEFKGPLYIITGHIKYLLSNISNNISLIQLEKRYKFALKECELLYSFINNYLFYEKSKSRQEELNKIKISIQNIIEDAIGRNQILCQEKGISVKNYLKDDFNIYADRILIEIVINNIIINACKHAERETILVIESKKINEDVILSFKDQGKGIPQEILANIFQKFNVNTIANEQGYYSSGLGLAICKDIIQKHQGTIHIHSILDEGTTVEIKFPKEMIIYEI